MEVHVISKTDNSHHATFTLDVDPTDLKGSSSSSSVQVRPLLFSLSSNNLSYARAGQSLHWWDTFPVPEHAPAPYNDTTAWGIVPAWGYGVVVNSTISPLPPGTVFWGFWPTADMLIDLELQATEPAGSWTEISKQRQRLMTLYNIYQETGKTLSNPLAPTIRQNEIQALAWEALFRPTWQSGYLMSEHVFAQNRKDALPIHPLGVGEWTSYDADLSAAVLVSLSASGKTGRSFAWNVLRRPLSSGPKGFLQVTSSPSSVSGTPQVLKSSLPTKAIVYSDIGDSAEWISGLTPSRIVIVDFGARANTLATLIASIKGNKALESLKMTILQVGSQQKVYTAEDSKIAAQEMSKFGKIQFNASGIRDAVIRSVGAESFHSTTQSVYKDWLEVSHDINLDIRIVMGSGIKGKDGVEGAWDRLSRGEVNIREGLVYKMSGVNVE